MREGRTKKAVKNIAYNVCHQVLTLILAFISRTLFIKYLGIEYLGISGLFADVLNMLSLADLGFNTSMVFSLYEPLKSNNREKISALITYYRRIYIVIAVTVSVVGIAIIPVLPLIINLEKDIPHLTLYYVLSLANVVISYLCIYKTSILIADQKQYKVTRVTIVIGTLRTLLQIASLVLFKSYLLYLLIGCFGVILTNIISSVVASKEYPYINEKRLLEKDEQKDIFSNIWPTFIYKLSNVLISATDNTLISILVGTLAVGYYSNYLLIQNKILIVYSIIFSSITASIGNLIVSENSERRYSVFKDEQSISFIVCGVVIPCYVILIDDFIKLWVGENYIMSTSTLIAIGLNLYFSFALYPLFGFREATGLFKKTKWMVFCCAVLNIFLSVILGKWKGISGILFASSISKVCTYIWYEPIILFDEFFGRKPFDYYISMIENLIIVATITAFVFFLGRFFVVDNWIMWILKASIIGLISLILTLLFYRKSSGITRIKSIFEHSRKT